MTYGFFLGCVAPMRYPGIEKATRLVFDKMGIDYGEMENASCCPAPGVTRSFDQKSWLALGARNLALAEKANQDLLTICNGCYGSLFEAAHELKASPDNGGNAHLDQANKVLSEIGMKYSGNTDVRHFVEVFHREIGVEKIKELVTKPLDLRVAVHYGCHFLKPTDIKGIDNAERPTILDEIVEATGAESIEYKDKNMCCGAGGGVRARVPDLARDMTKAKMESIQDAGADVIVNPCPFCHLQFDQAQPELGYVEKGNSIPVLHLSQLLGLAFGIEQELLGFKLHKTPVKLDL